LTPQATGASRVPHGLSEELACKNPNEMMVLACDHFNFDQCLQGVHGFEVKKSRRYWILTSSRVKHDQGGCLLPSLPAPRYSDNSGAFRSPCPYLRNRRHLRPKLLAPGYQLSSRLLREARKQKLGKHTGRDPGWGINHQLVGPTLNSNDSKLCFKRTSVLASQGP
jgi:hypothetical protein